MIGVESKLGRALSKDELNIIPFSLLDSDDENIEEIQLWLDRLTPARIKGMKVVASSLGREINIEYDDIPADLRRRAETAEITVDVCNDLVSWWESERNTKAYVDKGRRSLEVILNRPVGEEEYMSLPYAIRMYLSKEMSVLSAYTRYTTLLWYAKEMDMSDDDRMSYAYEAYLVAVNEDVEITTGILRKRGYEGERLYRALPDFITRTTGKVNPPALRSYIHVLCDVYGSTELRYDEA